MSKTEVRYRRPLNSEQLAVLDVLFRFRFATNEQLAHYFGKSLGKAVQKRLSILEAQGFIAKRYDGSYKLRGRPAEYYLLPGGARLLQAHRANQSYKSDGTKRAKIITDQAIKNRYKDKTVSAQFIAHSRCILSIYLKLQELYGDRLSFFTKSEMQNGDYFIRPLPDFHLSYKARSDSNDPPKRFLVDIFEDDIPFFVLIRRIKKYLSYYEGNEEEEWPDDNVPAILFIIESTKRQTQLRRRINKELRDAYMEDDGLVFATTTMNLLANSTTKKLKAWQPIDDLDDLIDLLSLSED